MSKEIFDDIVLGETGTWTQVCEKCAEKHSNLGCLEEIPINLICGVLGCNNEAKYYLDIYKEEFVNEK
ncbi:MULTISPECIES: hypothetical protein [Acinetobacter]|uniref:hypothetical protein n=1 Tax=Acinetobacter TaxID=469 RepID=UPI0021D31E4F|nr:MULTISPECIES: hypothetical protein [Acinetobacter]MCU4394868.1 hypothetical protein [Acinetobacter parvus]